MRRRLRSAVVVLLLLLAAPATVGAAIDPSGHWEGSIRVRGREAVQIEIDFWRNEQGQLGGALTTPGEKIRGLPLIHVAYEDGFISFYARRDQPFTGALTTNGMSIAGGYRTASYSAPFEVFRKGDVKIDPPPRNAAIGRELEGEWIGRAAGRGRRYELSLSNQPNGTSTGKMVSLDEGGLTMPVGRIAQDSTHVTLDLPAVHASYSGTVSPSGTELVGTFTDGTVSIAITFKRAAAAPVTK